ncbi:hypothetical protein ELI_3229 [Eubacterium callanderi]|uniref:Uncharacterized protein n=1 Tax=Eubacterium callanderi TaxID=53442 RepID=E3GF64_9FIRM|nr:hypothetical protein ELI_3229 [Eubacterium callanderi]
MAGVTVPCPPAFQNPLKLKNLTVQVGRALIPVRFYLAYFLLYKRFLIFISTFLACG